MVPITASPASTQTVASLDGSGGPKTVTDKQRKQCKQHMVITTAPAFPTLTTTQQESLRTAPLAWGIPFKASEEFSNPALVKLVSWWQSSHR